MPTMGHSAYFQACELGLGALAAESRRRAETVENIWNADRAVLLLEVLQQSNHRPPRDGRAVQRVHGRELLCVDAVADAKATCLVVGRVRRGGDLAVPLLPGEPRLDVVLLRCRRAELAGGDVDDAVGELELLHEVLLDLQ